MYQLDILAYLQKYFSLANVILDIGLFNIYLKMILFKLVARIPHYFWWLSLCMLNINCFDMELAFIDVEMIKCV